LGARGQKGRRNISRGSADDGTIFNVRNAAACYRRGAARTEEIVMTGCIVGWAHTKFGRHDGRDVESLIVEVAQGALADAGIAAADIDAVYLGTMNGGFVKQEFPASLVFQADPGFRFKPATRVENACATGSAAIHMGLNTIAAGKARLVLVVGVEKMTEVSGAEVNDLLLRASYRKEEDQIEGGFAGIFGRIAQMYFQRYGDQSDALARIAAKNHKNGVANPLAQMRRDLGYEFCRTVSDKNPLVAGPLKRTDCSLVSDGAAAVVLADTATALSMKKAVAFRAAEQVNDFLPISRRDILAFEGPALAWKRALGAARLGLDDLDLVETHDCFTIAELIEYEAMGLAPKGEGARAILEGWTEKDGRLPVNPSGGLKSKGHPVGATGVSMHVLAAMQVTGGAGDMQIPGAGLAGVMNMGGAAVANFVSILEPLRS
jgi:acetyl-CoA C-acetyltransferase